MLFLRYEEGQTLVEYSMILGSVFVLAMLALALAGANLAGLFSQIMEIFSKLVGF